MDQAEPDDESWRNGARRRTGCVLVALAASWAVLVFVVLVVVRVIGAW